ncbi:AraC-like DNA-binding protein [Streptomyces griseochromogenes]|uniref:AraC-like DNA-binding protein n=1 Tax=Streptomyces griseochromogenes TaxID=68214 RepID=A0ABS4M3Q4_9ACTN|nr:AraC-like DNA-binding protein [Streptomyces griseochromogenes]
MLTLPAGVASVSFFACPSLYSRRTPQLIRRSDPEVVQVAICLRQTIGVSQRRQEAVIQAGELFVYDTSQPYQAWMSGNGDIARMGVVHIPRNALPLPAAGMQRILARPLSGSRGIGAVLTSFLASLASQGATLNASDLARLGGVTVDLVTTYLAHHIDALQTVPGESRQRALLMTIYTFIEAHLHDPDLAPNTIAAAHHISLRQLHRLFQQEDTTVAALIRSRRLDHCRRDLENPTLQHLPIYAIGARWGFADAAGFSRSFRDTYAVTLGEYRRAAYTSRA